MRVLYNNDIQNISNQLKDTVVGLGNFDGLHIGHAELINNLISSAKVNGYTSVIYSFNNNSKNITNRRIKTPMITINKQKIEYLNDTGLDYLILDDFNDEFSKMSAEEFVKKILVNILHAKIVIVGYNYKFGYKRIGDIELLKSLGKEYNFDVIKISPIKVDHEIVSSSAIRKSIEDGDMRKTFSMLGRYYKLTGTVVYGKKLATTLGYPTANMHIKEHVVIPRNGVYITKTIYNKKSYNSVTNIGYNPTFRDAGDISIETNIFDFNEDIYGKEIDILFIDRLRDEIKFPDINHLVAQIEKDVYQAKLYYFYT